MYFLYPTLSKNIYIFGYSSEVPPHCLTTVRRVQEKKYIKKRKDGKRKKMGSINSEQNKILEDMNLNYQEVEDSYKGAKEKEDEAWKNYVTWRGQTNREHLKLIYMEALKRNKPIEWAEGKIEGLNLRLEEDEELQRIMELFN